MSGNFPEWLTAERSLPLDKVGVGWHCQTGKSTATRKKFIANPQHPKDEWVHYCKHWYWFVFVAFGGHNLDYYCRPLSIALDRTYLYTVPLRRPRILACICTQNALVSCSILRSRHIERRSWDLGIRQYLRIEWSDHISINVLYVGISVLLIQFRRRVWSGPATMTCDGWSTGDRAVQCLSVYHVTACEWEKGTLEGLEDLSQLLVGNWI